MSEQQYILHSDMNSFYASVEMLLDPKLRGKAVAVWGSTKERHGIVLAKSELAKKAGVKTGMVNWEARRLCRDLILVPPQYDEYLKFSKLAHQIYYRYTDQVEPYGMDENWLAVTHCLHRFGTPLALAESIRKTIREELGLTVSIGVSFNKIFAKLGSDMKKPDAITVITRENFREKVWPLPASDLLYVGHSTNRKLAQYGIHTIGDLAATDPEYLKRFRPRWEAILNRWQDLPQDELYFEKDIKSNATVFMSDILITDWSSVAYEFSFATKKPSVFVDTAMKMNNPDWEKIDVPQTDITLRNQVGRSFAQDDMAGVADCVAQMLAHQEDWRERISQITEQMVFNLGHGGEKAGEYLLTSILEKQEARAAASRAASSKEAEAR